MARLPSSSDPSTAAAALLRRIGLAVLALALPATAIFARRAVVLLLPIGAVLLVIAALLDGEMYSLRAKLWRLASSTGFLAAALGTMWAAASLAWTPALAPAEERLLGLVGTFGTALAAYLALPDRIRSANLYLIPVGTALGAVTAVANWLAGSGRGGGLGEDGRSVERGLIVLVLFVWPSIAWLRSRDRDAQAILLALAVAVAAVLAQNPFTPAALAIGALAYLATSLSPRIGAASVATVMAFLVALTPLLPFLLDPILPSGTEDQAWLGAFRAWASVVASDPVRLITGHGFGSVVQGRLAGSLPAAVPDTPLVQIWYDLGIVGALIAAIGLWVGPRSAVESYAPLLPSVVGAFATVSTLACMGVGNGQAWAPAAVSASILMFVAAQRGQFRTRRPRTRDLAALR